MPRRGVSAVTANTQVTAKKTQNGYFHRLGRCISANKSLYLMIVPVLLFYIVFHYAPMYGVIIAFKNFQPGLGIM